MFILKFSKEIFILFLSFLFLLAVANFAQAFEIEKYSKNSALNQNLKKTINELLEIKYQGSKLPERANLEQLLDFMIVSEGKLVKTQPESYRGAMGIFYKTGVDRKLADFVRYIVNSEIPSVLVYPSGIRYSHMVEESQAKALNKKAWEYLNDELTEPLSFWDTDFVEISPDTFSGTYYGYKTQRMVVFMKHRGKPYCS